MKSLVLTPGYEAKLAIDLVLTSFMSLRLHCMRHHHPWCFHLYMYIAHSRVTVVQMETLATDNGMASSTVLINMALGLERKMTGSGAQSFLKNLIKSKWLSEIVKTCQYTYGVHYQLSSVSRQIWSRSTICFRIETFPIRYIQGRCCDLSVLQRNRCEGKIIIIMFCVLQDNTYVREMPAVMKAVISSFTCFAQPALLKGGKIIYDTIIVRKRT